MDASDCRLLKLELPNRTCPIDTWLRGIRDAAIRARVVRGIDKLARGVGDWKPVREGVLELRLDLGPGYRVYYGRWHSTIIVLLAGGDKSTQVSDISRAVRLWHEFLASGLRADDLAPWPGTEVQSPSGEEGGP